MVSNSTYIPRLTLTTLRIYISIQVKLEFTVVTNCMCSLFHLDCYKHCNPEFFLYLITVVMARFRLSQHVWACVRLVCYFVCLPVLPAPFLKCAVN